LLFFSAFCLLFFLLPFSVWSFGFFCNFFYFACVACPFLLVLFFFLTFLFIRFFFLLLCSVLFHLFFPISLF
jgi:hypothetical protein